MSGALLNVITGTAGALARNAPQGAKFFGSIKKAHGSSLRAPRSFAGEGARGPSKKSLGKFQTDPLPETPIGISYVFLGPLNRGLLRELFVIVD